MVKTSGSSKSKSSVADCRVLDIGISGMAECLNQGPCTCSYAVPFGYCFLCKHPRLDEILVNTKKAQLVAAAVK